MTFVLIAYQEGSFVGRRGRTRARDRGAADQNGVRVHRHVVARAAVPLLLQVHLVRMAAGVPLLRRWSPGTCPTRPKELCFIYGFISFSSSVAQLFSGIALCCLDSHYKVWPLAEHTKSNPLHCRASDLNGTNCCQIEMMCTEYAIVVGPK
jgi:hypothetical protein